jgi:hypothetical protein
LSNTEGWNVIEELEIAPQVSPETLIDVWYNSGAIDYKIQAGSLGTTWCTEHGIGMYAWRLTQE